MKILNNVIVDKNVSSELVGNSSTSTKLKTPRTITLSGDVSGSTTFDGSGNVSMTTTITDDSHNHIISNIDGLQTALDSKVDDSQVLTNVPINAIFTDTVYTHPTTSGNKHIPSGGASGQFLKWSASGTAIWAADNNTTYAVATTSTNGLLSSIDKTKIDSIASNSNNSLISTTQPTTQSIGDIWFVEVLR